MVADAVVRRCVAIRAGQPHCHWWAGTTDDAVRWPSAAAREVSESAARGWLPNFYPAGILLWLPLRSAMRGGPDGSYQRQLPGAIGPRAFTSRASKHTRRTLAGARPQGRVVSRAVWCHTLPPAWRLARCTPTWSASTTGPSSPYLLAEHRYQLPAAPIRHQVLIEQLPEGSPDSQQGHPSRAL